MNQNARSEYLFRSHTHSFTLLWEYIVDFEEMKSHIPAKKKTPYKPRNN